MRWLSGKTPVVRGKEREADGNGPVPQHRDDWPGPQPDGLVGDLSTAVELEDFDALLETIAGK